MQVLQIGMHVLATNPAFVDVVLQGLVVMPEHAAEALAIQRFGAFVVERTARCETKSWVSQSSGDVQRARATSLDGKECGRGPQQHTGPVFGEPGIEPPAWQLAQHEKIAGVVGRVLV
ncbi:hypothetical protein SSTU70S_01010 [Stutzerimonas stutzeri]